MNAHDLLMQAQDHFMRGIFHMPHSAPRYASNHPHWDPTDRTPDISAKRRSGELALRPTSPRFSPPNRPQTRASTRAMKSPGPGSPPKTLSKTSMPRPSLHLNMAAASTSRPDRSTSKPHMSRPRTLYTIGSEVLKVAERLLPNTPPSTASRQPHPQSGSPAASPAHLRVMRQRERDCIEWAEYADTVFMQLEGELKELGSKGLCCISPSMVSACRGRCAQIVGRALATSRDSSMDGASASGRNRGTPGRSSSGVEREDASFYLRKGMFQN
jgi:hypothetical protein